MVLLLAGQAAAGGGTTATAAVEAFQKDLLGVMKEAAALGLRGRYERLLPVIKRSFHVPIMVRIATGRHWPKADEARRAGLIAAFGRMSASTLATFFDSYDGETFEVVRQRKGSGAVLLVDTRVIRPEKDPVDISYVVGKYGERWRMVDVIVSGGISELTVRRSEYARILEAGGVEALIARLNDTADRILAKADKAMGASARR